MGKKHERHSLSVLGAVEALSTLADLKVNREGDQLFIPGLSMEKNKNFSYYLRGEEQKTPEKIIPLVRETFGVVLTYLRDFYKNECRNHIDAHAMERIKNIMGLVGEAAKKFDRCSTLVYGDKGTKSITSLKEYKKLQEFYSNKIVRQVDENVLGRWVLALTQKAVERKKELSKSVHENPIRYLFVDLDVIKRDADYELLFVRKEDGSYFFSPRLIRNMKLVCDFSVAQKEQDSLDSLREWEDEALMSAAKGVLKSLNPLIGRFYKDAFRFKHREHVATIHSCLMALMLCANPHNLLREESTKSCHDYFFDFLYFLREALDGDDYHQLITYPPSKGNLVNTSVLDIVHALCRALYADMWLFHSLAPYFDKVIGDARDAGRQKKNREEEGTLEVISERLQEEYTSLVKALHFHSNGPLKKMLATFRYGYSRSFDPFVLRNLPSALYNLVLGDRRIVALHLPSPTHQDYIHKVSVLDEFKGFLRSYAAGPSQEKHLLIVMQDRTSWKEHTRALALEELSKNQEFQPSLAVATLAKDTDFYHQLKPYDTLGKAEEFFETFKEHFADENSGYYFSSSVATRLLAEFLDGAIGAIHRIFFYNKNTLTRSHRLDFIEIFDLFLTLKLIDVVRPTSFSLSCKDGVDVGACSSALLCLFVKMMGTDSLSDEDWQQVHTVLHAPALLVRERTVLPERFDRMASALKTIEFVYRDLGSEVFKKVIQEAFGLMFEEDILQAPVISSTPF